MGDHFSRLIVTAAIAAAAAGGAISVSVIGSSAQAPAVSGAALQTAPLKTAPLKTAWGEPDLQGIWTNEFDTPLQRSAKFGNQEFFNRRATRRAGPRALGHSQQARDRAERQQRL